MCCFLHLPIPFYSRFSIPFCSCTGGWHRAWKETASPGLEHTKEEQFKHSWVIRRVSPSHEQEKWSHARVWCMFQRESVDGKFHAFPLANYLMERSYMIKYAKLLCGLKWYKWPEFNSIDFAGCGTWAEFQTCPRSEEQHAFSSSVKSHGSCMLPWGWWLSVLCWAQQ